jgi:hypothetical protein
MPNEKQRQFEEPTLTEQGSLATVTLVSPTDGGGGGIPT